jgi:hypothetical protein
VTTRRGGIAAAAAAAAVLSAAAKIPKVTIEVVSGLLEPKRLTVAQTLRARDCFPQPEVVQCRVEGVVERASAGAVGFVVGETRHLKERRASYLYESAPGTPSAGVEQW